MAHHENESRANGGAEKGEARGGKGKGKRIHGTTSKIPDRARRPAGTGANHGRKGVLLEDSPGENSPF